MSAKSISIAEWCAEENLSRSMFYKLDSLGKAPATYFVGRIRRISPEARAAWRADRIAERR
jgi:hypothetical protein